MIRCWVKALKLLHRRFLYREWEDFKLLERSTRKSSFYYCLVWRSVTDFSRELYDEVLFVINYLLVIFDCLFCEMWVTRRWKSGYWVRKLTIWLISNSFRPIFNLIEYVLSQKIAIYYRGNEIGKKAPKNSSLISCSQYLLHPRCFLFIISNPNLYPHHKLLPRGQRGEYIGSIFDRRESWWGQLVSFCSKHTTHFLLLPISTRNWNW